MYYRIVVAVILLDQALKYVIRTNMEASPGAGASIQVIPGFFRISYYQNTGAAFSILQGQRLLLICLTAVMLAALLAYLFFNRKKGERMFLVGISLIAAGGIGNLADRIRLGYVVDFFDFGTFPVFNTADVAVCTGCGLIVLYFVLSELAAAKKKSSCEASE
ncbi:MAG: signal peptidase II [Clostridiales Family XIII bacterium]|jgi:signal peptidase II|nr:signal peptidase II [Clostridiales Family XIII bacterium]